MGTCLPQVLSTSKPTLNHRGRVISFAFLLMRLMSFTWPYPELIYVNRDFKELFSTCPPGLWLELELMYTGCFQLTLATKMNLCKLGKEEEAHGITENQPEGYDPHSRFYPHQWLKLKKTKDVCFSALNPGCAFWLTVMKSRPAPAHRMKRKSLPLSSWGQWVIRAQQTMCMLIIIPSSRRCVRLARRTE